MVTQTAPSDSAKLEGPVQKLRLVERARSLFHRLRDVGTQRDKAGNRTFLFSHHASLVLLSVFNPVMQSLRGLQQASELKQVQERLGIGRVSLGSLSESCRVFDPELLVPIVHELLAELPASAKGPGPKRSLSETIPQELARQLVAVDGSTFRALPQIVQAAAEGSWKLHLQFRPLSGLPASARVEPEYAYDERDVLAAQLEPGCVYIADRGYERYALFNRIVAARSDYVIRAQSRPAKVVEERPLSAAARSARVVSDAIVILGSAKVAAGVARIDHPIRRIVIEKKPQGRQRTDRTANDQIILLTNRLDLAAEVIAAIYELRWCIELFFRFLKQMLGCKRLYSTKSEGVAIQIYCALIACLLMAQITGGRVTMEAYRMICFYLQGWADEKELLKALERLLKDDS